MVEQDQDVVVQILKAKQARREYEFRLNAAGDANAPGVVDLKEACDRARGEACHLRKEKAETFERARRVGEAKKIAAEMETLIRTLQQQQEQFDTAKAQLAKAEKQLARTALARQGRRGRPDGNGVTSTTRRQRHRHHRRHLPPARPAVLPDADGAELAAAREGDPAGVEPDPEGMKKQIIGTVFAGLMGFVLMGLGRGRVRDDVPAGQFARPT